MLTAFNLMAFTPNKVIQPDMDDALSQKVQNEKQHQNRGVASEKSKVKEEEKKNPERDVAGEKGDKPYSGEDEKIEYYKYWWFDKF